MYLVTGYDDGFKNRCELVRHVGSSANWIIGIILPFFLYLLFFSGTELTMH